MAARILIINHRAKAPDTSLGKKGEVSLMMRELGKMSVEEKKVMGPALNGLKNDLNALIEAKKSDLENAALDNALASETMDMSLPLKRAKGSLHPVPQVMEEMAVIFSDMGFSVAEGPDIEDDFHNFTALNFPPGHPARDMHDTFFMSAVEGEDEKKVLRTHTSPVQIRTMINQEPPIRIIAPGRTYRCDSDQTHTPMFHQVEGLVIDNKAKNGWKSSAAVWCTLMCFAPAVSTQKNIKVSPLAWASTASLC